MLGLELPTGGLADALGRKPVLVAAAAFKPGFARDCSRSRESVWMFPAVALLLQGVYRALESGPLDAWYVDAALAADPKADLEGGLSAAGVVTGVSIATGALISRRARRARPDVGRVPALTVPVLVAVALSAVDLVALAWLLVEDRPGPARPRGAPSRCAAVPAHDRLRLRPRTPVPDRARAHLLWRSSGVSAW